MVDYFGSYNANIPGKGFEHLGIKINLILACF